METISTDHPLVDWPHAVAIGYLLFAIACASLCVYLYNRLKRFLRREAEHEVRMRHLNDEAVRRELSAFLRKQMVVGDADIREGLVLPPVPADRLEPLAVVLSNSVALIQTCINPAADSLYIRSKDGSFRLIDLDLDHLVDAARVMQRVAEDRRKSRSIYKGMTDDEMVSLTRAGLSQAFKDSGEFEVSNQIMAGGWDTHPEFERTLRVLDLVFKVKGSRGD